MREVWTVVPEQLGIKCLGGPNNVWIPSHKPANYVKYAQSPDGRIIEIITALCHTCYAEQQIKGAIRP